MSKIRNILATFVLLSFITIFIGFIFIVWFGLIGIKLAMTGLILFILFLLLFEASKREKEISANDN